MLVRIKRQRAQHQEPYWQTFEYNNSNENATVVTVLNALNYTDDLFDIEGKPAGRIRWECSCMQGVCGGCAMVINNTPSLACSTFLKDIKGDLVIEPLTKFPVIADLMVDRNIIHENINKVQAYLNDKTQINEVNDAHRYSVAKCLKCGLCLEVCPNYSYDTDFFGAVFANDSYLLYSNQTKDQKQLVNAYKKHFASHCSKALSCQTVCPVKIETLTSILKMNRAR